MKENNLEPLDRQAIHALPECARLVMEYFALVMKEKARRKKTNEININVDEVLRGLYEGIPKHNEQQTISAYCRTKLSLENFNSTGTSRAPSCDGVNSARDLIADFSPAIR